MRTRSSRSTVSSRLEPFDCLLERHALRRVGRSGVVTLRRPRWSDWRSRKLQLIGCQERGVGQQRDSLHHVRHFPHVPGPAVGDEGCPRVVCKRFRRQPILGTGVRQEVFGESEDVLSPLSKRRESKRHHCKPVVELLAKSWPTRPGL